MSDFYWGVDVGMNSTAIACLPATDGEPHLMAPRAGEGTLPERLDELMASTERCAGQLCSDCPPMIVLVEKPTGKFVKPHLIYAVGIVTLALHRALKDRFIYPVSVIQIGVSEWKKGTVGKGNATKSDVADWARSRWDWLEGITQDEADALCIAEFARTSLTVGTAR